MAEEKLENKPKRNYEKGEKTTKTGRKPYQRKNNTKSGKVSTSKEEKVEKTTKTTAQGKRRTMKTSSMVSNLNKDTVERKRKTKKSGDAIFKASKLKIIPWVMISPLILSTFFSK